MILLLDISVGYFVSQDCAFLDKLKQGKNKTWLLILTELNDIKGGE